MDYPDAGYLSYNSQESIGTVDEHGRGPVEEKFLCTVMCIIRAVQTGVEGICNLDIALNLSMVAQVHGLALSKGCVMLNLRLRSNGSYRIKKFAARKF